MRIFEARHLVAGVRVDTDERGRPRLRPFTQNFSADAGPAETAGARGFRGAKAHGRGVAGVSTAVARRAAEPREAERAAPRGFPSSRRRDLRGLAPGAVAGPAGGRWAPEEAQGPPPI